MDPRIIRLYDEYTHKPLDRRVFLERLAVLAGGATAAGALLPLLENNYAQAEIVDPGDQRLATERVTYRGAGRRDRRSPLDRKSTRLNSSHQIISYAVFCLKKK